MKKMLFGIVLIIISVVSVLNLISLSINISHLLGSYNGGYNYLKYLNIYGIDKYLYFSALLFFIGIVLCVIDIFNDKKKN